MKADTVLSSARCLACALASAALAGLAAGPVYASLGGDLPSVRHDHAAIHAADLVTSTLHYDVHEGVNASGQRIREYVDHAGKVFAVSWQGPRSPDIAGLLGAYAARYVAAARAHHGGHHVLVIADRDLSVSIIRLPRGWQGRASLPLAVPAGVAPAEIR